jgi:hypothetical protein
MGQRLLQMARVTEGIPQRLFDGFQLGRGGGRGVKVDVQADIAE